MPDYQAPLRDLRFVMDEVLDYPTHYAGLPGGEEATPDVVGAILEEGARFAREELLPLNQSGDLEAVCSRAERSRRRRGSRRRTTAMWRVAGRVWLLTRNRVGKGCRRRLPWCSRR